MRNDDKVKYLIVNRVSSNWKVFVVTIKKLLINLKFILYYDTNTRKNHIKIVKKLATLV